MGDIAAAGFTAVQTSPVTECITTHPFGGEGMNLGGPDGFWWFHYQPVSFNIGNFQLGTEEEFIEMCRIAAEHNVKIIVDAVVNHMAASRNCISDEVKDIPGGAFHERGSISNWNDRFQITQRQLLGLWDLNTQNPNVQQAVLDFLKRCIELGASGFRYDAALHIELPGDDPAFASDFWPVVLDNGAEFQYGEILNRAMAAKYTEYMKVTDSTYGSTIAGAVRRGNLNAAVLENYSVNTSADMLITWVESHDTFCNEGETANLTEKQLIYGWAVLCARDASTPLFLSRPMGSSPGKDTRWGNNIAGARGNDAFKSPEVTALNHFKIAMDGTAEHFSNPTESNNLLMIERGGNGAVIINTGEQVSLNAVAVNLLRDGKYECRISGNEFTVSDGKLSGTVNTESVVVIY
jgi:alpha-amylase